MEYIASQIVSIQGEKFAIPRENIKELISIPGAKVKEKIDTVGKRPVVRLRQKFIPLVDLADILGIHRRDTIFDGGISSAVNIAIVFAEEFTYGLIVDTFHDSQEIGILPAGRYLSQAEIYLGTATLQNDRAILVLDILSIAHTSGLSRAFESVNHARSNLIEPAGSAESETLSLLTFRNSGTECFAVNLESVERLERFSTSDFEKAGKREVVQYRGGVLPLFELSQIVNCSELIPSKHRDVLVIKLGDTLAGLKVQPPVDNIECCKSIDRSIFNTPPLKGSIILNQRTTLLLDGPAMVQWIQRGCE